MNHPRAGCVVHALENPLLNGILLGLKVSESDVEVQANFFPCCHGSAERFEAATQTLRRCDLKKRLQTTRLLLARYYQEWWQIHPHWPHQLSPEQSAVILRECSQILKGNAPQALIRAGEKQKPGLIYAMALAYSWRFGATVRMFHFGRNSVASFLAQDWRDDSTALVICVQQVTGLWDPKVATEFESIVSFAYRANAVLLVEEVQLPMAEKSGFTRSAKTIVAQKLQVEKSKPLTEFLEASTRARLNDMMLRPLLLAEEI